MNGIGSKELINWARMNGVKELPEGESDDDLKKRILERMSEHREEVEGKRQKELKADDEFLREHKIGPYKHV